MSAFPNSGYSISLKSAKTEGQLTAISRPCEQSASARCSELFTSPSGGLPDGGIRIERLAKFRVL